MAIDWRRVTFTEHMTEAAALVAECHVVLDFGSEHRVSYELKVYESLVKEFPDSIYKQDAEDRIAVLSKGSGQEFYAWFAKYQRPKTDDKRPHDKTADDLIDDIGLGSEKALVLPDFQFRTRQQDARRQRLDYRPAVARRLLQEK